MASRERSSGRLVLWIVLGVLVWGIIHAAGAYLNYRDTYDAWRVLRAVVVIVCVEGFLGFWMILLAFRRGRIDRRRDADAK